VAAQIKDHRAAAAIQAAREPEQLPSYTPAASHQVAMPEGLTVTSHRLAKAVRVSKGGRSQPGLRSRLSARFSTVGRRGFAWPSWPRWRTPVLLLCGHILSVLDKFEGTGSFFEKPVKIKQASEWRVSGCAGERHQERRQHLFRGVWCCASSSQTVVGFTVWGTLQEP